MVATIMLPSPMVNGEPWRSKLVLRKLPGLQNHLVVIRIWRPHDIQTTESGEGKKWVCESEHCIRQPLCNTTHTGRVELIMVPGLKRSGDRPQVQRV
eukprot:13317974-Ditylum_brightwellii.AAC.1